MGFLSKLKKSALEKDEPQTQPKPQLSETTNSAQAPAIKRIAGVHKIYSSGMMEAEDEESKEDQPEEEAKYCKIEVKDKDEGFSDITKESLDEV